MAVGCGSKSDDNSGSSADSNDAKSEVSADNANDAENADDTDNTDDVGDADNSGDADNALNIEVNYDEAVNVGSLKGPTTMGIVNLMEKNENGESLLDYNFDMETDASVIASKMVSGELNIAMIPANLAATLYKKTEGNIEVLYINTLGVLDCVTGDESIKSIKDLDGKTVVMTGQGTTPEYVTRYLLEANGVEANLEFKSEATEVAAVLAADSSAIGILPQPFATVAQVQNEEVKLAFSLTDEWNEVSENNSMLLTGVTITTKSFAEEHPDVIEAFMAEAEESVDAANTDTDSTAALVVKYGVLEKEPIAKKALPNCNIAYITGRDMKEALSGYLEVLYSYDQTSVGGALPEDDFYYEAE